MSFQLFYCAMWGTRLDIWTRATNAFREREAAASAIWSGVTLRRSSERTDSLTPSLAQRRRRKRFPAKRGRGIRKKRMRRYRQSKYCLIATLLTGWSNFNSTLKLMSTCSIGGKKYQLTHQLGGDFGKYDIIRLVMALTQTWELIKISQTLQHIFSSKLLCLLVRYHT